MSELVFKMGESPAETVAGCGGTILNVFNRLNTPMTKLELALCVFPVREKAREHHHKWTEEMYVVVSGRGLIYLDGMPHELGPGDAIALPIGVCHQMTNPGDEDLVFWSVNSTPYDEKDIHYR